MSSSVQELCEALASAFSDGRLNGLAAFYAYPLAIYSPGRVRVEVTPEETESALFRRRGLALRAGMRSVRVRIWDVAEMTGGRIPVRLSWEFLDADGQRVGLSAMRYFCRRSPDGTLKVEMIEFTELAFSDGPNGAGSGTPA